MAHDVLLTCSLHVHLSTRAAKNDLKDDHRIVSTLEKPFGLGQVSCRRIAPLFTLLPPDLGCPHLSTRRVSGLAIPIHRHHQSPFASRREPAPPPPPAWPPLPSTVVAGAAVDDAATTVAATAACPHRDGRDHHCRAHRVDASGRLFLAVRTRGGARGGRGTGGNADLHAASSRRRRGERRVTAYAAAATPPRYYLERMRAPPRRRRPRRGPRLLPAADAGAPALARAVPCVAGPLAAERVANGLRRARAPGGSAADAFGSPLPLLPFGMIASREGGWRRNGRGPLHRTPRLRSPQCLTHF